MQRGSIKLALSYDPGSTAYLLSPVEAEIERAFAAFFPDIQLNREYAIHSWAAGTTLDLVITGLSLGVGVIAGEILKEAGKDLWGALKKLVRHEPMAQDEHSRNGNDSVSITLVLGDSTLNAKLTGLGPGQSADLELFALHTPSALLEEALSWLGDPALCATCAHRERAPIDMPCRYCTNQGGKLRIINNDVRALDGRVLIPYPDRGSRKRLLWSPRPDV